MSSAFFRIPGNVISKKNSKIATVIGGVHCPRRPIILPSTAYKKWERQARQHFQATYRRHIPITSKCSIRAIFYYKGPQPDLSGCMESIADCLEGFAWENDKLIESWDGSRAVHNKLDQYTSLEVTWDGE